MPTYEYACKACGEHLEIVQSFKDGALTECPACGGPLRKVFGNIGIAFRGSGFYRTDSRSASGKPAKGTETKAGDKTADAGAGSSKTETATTPKAEGSKDSGTKEGGAKESGAKTGGTSTTSKASVAS